MLREHSNPLRPHRTSQTSNGSIALFLAILCLFSSPTNGGAQGWITSNRLVTNTQPLTLLVGGERITIPARFLHLDRMNIKEGNTEGLSFSFPWPLGKTDGPWVYVGGLHFRPYRSSLSPNGKFERMKAREGNICEYSVGEFKVLIWGCNYPQVYYECFYVGRADIQSYMKCFVPVPEQAAGARVQRFSQFTGEVEIGGGKMSLSLSIPGILAPEFGKIIQQVEAFVADWRH